MCKRVLSVLLAVTVAATLLSGCARNRGVAEAEINQQEATSEETADEANEVTKNVEAKPEEQINKEEIKEESLEEEAEEDVNIAPLSVLVNQLSLSSKLSDGTTCMVGSQELVTIAPKTPIEFAEGQEEHAELANSINKLMDELSTNYENTYNDILDMIDEEVEDRLPLSYETNISVVRADSRAFSMIYTESTYTGGAHPGFGVTAYSYDAKTGKPIDLDDVVTDKAKLAKLVVDGIPKDIDLLEDKEEVRKSIENGYSNFVVDNVGITYYFSPYDIAPWAAGTIVVTVTFFDNPDLFKDYYCWTQMSYAAKPVPGLDYMDYSVDYKNVVPLTVYSVGNPGGNYSAISIYAGKYSDEQEVDNATNITYEYFQTIDYGKILYADVLTAKGEESIYVWELSEENGIKFMGKRDNLGLALYPETIGDYDYYQLATHPEGMMLGTGTSSKEYYVGEDGMPTKN